MNTALTSAASTPRTRFREFASHLFVSVGLFVFAFLAFCLNYYSSLLLKIEWSGRADALYLRLSSRQTILLRVVPFKLLKRPLGMECNSLNVPWQLYSSGWSSSFGRWNKFSWNLLWDRQSALGEFMWIRVLCFLQCHNFKHRKCYHRCMISPHRTTIVRARAASINFFAIHCHIASTDGGDREITYINTEYNCTIVVIYMTYLSWARSIQA